MREEPVTTAEREEYASACVEVAEKRLKSMWYQPQYSQRAADVRIAIGLLTRAAALMDELAQEEKR